MENTHLLRSLLGKPEELEIKAADEVKNWGRVMVFAPHPDDESLGCGGAIALLREAGMTVQIVIVSDDSRSHLNSKTYPTAILSVLRKSELMSAAHTLGVPLKEVIWMGVQDGKIPKSHEAEFVLLSERMQSVIEVFQPDTILTPWRRDVHHDHTATTALVKNAIGNCENSPRILEYPIWVWETCGNDESTRPSAIS